MNHRIISPSTSRSFNIPPLNHQNVLSNAETVLCPAERSSSDFQKYRNGRACKWHASNLPPLGAAARTRHIRLIFRRRFCTRGNYNNNRPPRGSPFAPRLCLRAFREIDLTYSLAYANQRRYATKRRRLFFQFSAAESLRANLLSRKLCHFLDF